MFLIVVHNPVAIFHAQLLLMSALVGVRMIQSKVEIGKAATPYNKLYAHLLHSQLMIVTFRDFLQIYDPQFGLCYTFNYDER